MPPQSWAHHVLSVKSITTKISRRFAVGRDVGVYEDVCGGLRAQGCFRMLHREKGHDP